MSSVPIEPTPSPATAAASAAADPGVPRWPLFGYAVGSIGSAMFNTVPGLLLLFYLTNALGVPPALAGLVVFVPKGWDVVFSPIIGALSDREALRTGSRSRLMLIGALSLPLVFALTFCSPHTGTDGAIWVFVAYLLAATAYACFQVPYVSLPTEMSASPTERTRIMGWRIIAVTVGILVGGALAPLIVKSCGGGQVGYRTMGIAMGLVELLVLLVANLSSRWVRSQPSGEALGLMASFRVALGNRAFFILMASYALQAVGLATMLAAITYVSTYLLQDPALTTVIFLAVVAPSIVAVPLWSRLAKRWGKTRTLQVITVVFAGAALLMLPAVLSGKLWLVLTVTLVQGCAFAGQQVLPFAMLPDTIVADAQRTGRQQAGAFTGVFTAMETAMFAVGPGVFSIILSLTGYISSTAEQHVQQSPLALQGILIGFTLIPAVLILASLPLVVLYGRTEAARIGDE